MKAWQERPFETRNLFNPAFCGVLILRALKAYEAEDDDGMPFSLALLILPLCLHSATREIVNLSPRTYFIKTVESHPEILVGLGQRTRNLLPFTFEGLGFTMQLGSFSVTENGRLKTSDKAIRGKVDGTQESIDCQKAAQTIGKHFGRLADRVTIYTTLGIRP
jgi:hypothetical protein